MPRPGKKSSARKKKPRRAGPPAAAQRSLPPPPSPLLMEREMDKLGRLLEGHEFESIEEANAFLQQLMEGTGGCLPESEPDSPERKAQELIYQAHEARSRKRRAELARQALEIYADCADAYVLLAGECGDLAQAAKLLAQGVAAGERALGPEFFQEEAGGFWGITRSRPYMRARQGLAEVLWELERRDEAIAHARELLRLNPNDNQGIRDLLAPWLVETDHDEELEALLKQYQDDCSAVWAYTRALHAFRREGDTPGARKRLKAAFETNRHVPVYMLGGKPLPKRLPQYIGLGDENEAVAYAVGNVPAWIHTSGGVRWMLEVMEEVLQDRQDRQARPT
jgi:tetratricopeptide (TPR) repeat protein